MRSPLSGFTRGLGWLLASLVLGSSLPGQPPEPLTPVSYDADSSALTLARKYVEGGDSSRAALLDALQRMGWGVRNAQGVMLKAPPAGTDCGLALRDYELEELLWKPSEQPAVRLISVAQALAVPFGNSDPEELAHDLIETIRKSVDSPQPQQRFWGRFIVALGEVSPAGYDLTAAGPALEIPLSKAERKKLEEEAKKNPLAMLGALKTNPVWPVDDPVLAPSPQPKRAAGQSSSRYSPERDQQRMKEISEQMQQLATAMKQATPPAQTTLQEKMTRLGTELQGIATRQQAAALQQMTSALQQFQGAPAKNTPANSGKNQAPRFVAEWRDQPVSLLQIALISRVLSADVRLAVSRGKNSPGHASGIPVHRGRPLAMIRVAQASGSISFGDQAAGVAGDAWATGWGAFTGAVLDHHLPDNNFSKGVSIANTIIAWFKTIMSVARQNITVEVDNVPLIRTKTRSPGEKRTAHCRVAIDFPKSDVLKAIRAAGNLTSIDLSLPDGGPVGGAKVVWRLPEGSYNTKYQTAKGGSAYKPELAVVQFAEAGGPAAYVSTTNEDGETSITIEGVPQRKQLSNTVRPYPRRAMVAVEVTIKVGNITQDFNDAINAAMGGVVSGGLTFIADMVLRTSFFFQKGKVFEVTDWKEPAWEGDFDITVTAAGSKHQKGEKGGPDADYQWSMNRYMEGRLHTPDWDEENEDKKNYDNDGRHHLEIDGDSRYFRLDDSSSAKTRSNQKRYEAVGPMQVQPPGRNQLEIFSRSEPSGSAELMFNGGTMTLDLKPFFGAMCIVGRSEQGGGRSVNQAGPQYLSLLDGVYPDTFTIIESNDGSSDYVEGSKTYDSNGNLPYVPGFRAKVTVKYHLWKNGPPPKNQPR